MLKICQVRVKLIDKNEKLIYYLVPIFEPHTSSLAMFLVGQLPLKELMVRMTMQTVIILLTHMDNEMCLQQSTAANKKYIEFETQDFVMGFDRRLVLLISNAFILNSPKELLNGAILKKFIKTGKIIYKISR